ncbi:MAG TPA: T9SS type A sorting domain-containing protein, partial [Candidatus Cloacimonadota bacterium]|nr:T9SS type A sorting domain-containing protein [Candidatus Cloacimonadota bacterium]
LLPGTYSRGSNQQIFSIAIKSWVNIVGSGSDVTILEGSPSPGSDYTYGSSSVFHSYDERGWSIQSLSITSDWFEGSSAMNCEHESKILLKDLHIHHFRPNNNSVLSFYSLDQSLWENVTVENVVSDKGGMVEVGKFSRGTLRNVDVRNGLNTFVSDEVWAWPLFSIHMDDWLNFENCSFVNLVMTDEDSNLMQVGGMQYPAQHNQIRFINCLFSDLVSYGDMIVIGSSNHPTIDIINCTVTGNSSWYYTFMLNGTVNITNSIFFNDCMREILPNLYLTEPETSIFNVGYSSFSEGQTSISHTYGSTINYDDTNNDLDPLFYGDQQQINPPYSLTSASPCIDSGSPDTTGLGLLPYDLAGNRRIWNCVIDRGCYEYGSETWVTVDDPVVPELPDDQLTIYPNPFSSLAFIRVDLDQAKTDKHRGLVMLSIYNLRGQRLWSHALEGSGRTRQVLSWDGRDGNGSRCANGIYLVRLTVNG